MEDEKLIIRCQQGDKEAFQNLISKYHPFVYKFLIRLTGDKTLAEDLTQDVFLKIIRNIDRFNVHGGAKFSTYLIAIAKNCYIDELRRTSRVSVNFDTTENIRDLVDEKNIDEIVVEKLYSMEIGGSLKNLTEEQRIAIKLKYNEGLSLKEISEILNIEPKTVKSRIHNGMVKLRKLLIKRGEINEK